MSRRDSWSYSNALDNTDDLLIDAVQQGRVDLRMAERYVKGHLAFHLHAGVRRRSNSEVFCAVVQKACPKAVVRNRVRGLDKRLKEQANCAMFGASASKHLVQSPRAFRAFGVDRELVLAPGGAVVCEDELPDQIVERATTVMKELADKDAPSRVGPLVDTDSNTPPLSFAFEVVGDRIGVSLVVPPDLIVEKIQLVPCAVEPQTDSF